jgi:uncharacterized protein (TIGR01777 family)
VRIAITGSSGFLGTALRRHLESRGHQVLPVVRRAPGPGEIGWDPAAGRLEPGDLGGIDAVVNLAGENMGERRWTAERKRRIVESRVESTRLLAEAMAAADDRPPLLLSGSAIGYYGDRGDEVLTEASSPGGDFLAGVCIEWEAATEAAAAAGVRVALLRTAPVLDRSGGIFPRMALPFRLGFGGRLGSGRQWMSWISLTDHLGAISFLLDHDVRGPVDLAAPEPVTNREMTKALGAVLHRPAFLAAPAFALRLALGRERADNLLFVSQRVVPAVLQDAGYEFRHPHLVGALEAAVRGGGDDDR